MTPKAKAEELIDMFKFYTKVFFNGRWDDDLHSSKKCAIISVKEMYNIACDNDNIEQMEFLKQVEKEINKF